MNKREKEEAFVGQKLMESLRSSGLYDATKYPKMPEITYTPLSTYSSLKLGSAVVCRVKAGGKAPYLAIKALYVDNLTDANIKYWQIKSDPDYLRFDLAHHENTLTIFSILFNICIGLWQDMIADQYFGCCSCYMECSDKLKCVQQDQALAFLCQYRKKLDKGIIFYGKNRNVDYPLDCKE